MKRILSVDGNKKQVFHYSDHDDTAAIETIIDAEPLVRHVRKMRHMKRNKSEVTNYVGSVDMTLFLKWAKEKHISTQEAMSDNRYLVQYLNDPDNAKFKAVDGKI